MTSKSMTVVTMMVALVALMCGFTNSASAAGTPTGDQSWIGQSFDFGDVRGGYATNSGDMVSMGANLSLSSGVITQVSADVWREPWNNGDGRNYFRVTIGFWGTYDTAPTMVNGLYASQNATHHGAMIGGDASLGSYQEWLPTDTTDPTGFIWSSANASLQIEPFVIMSAQGNFEDYSWTDSDGNTYNNFGYHIYWEGYTDDPVAATVFGSIQPMTVPEPATMAILVIGGIFAITRRRNKR